MTPKEARQLAKLLKESREARGLSATEVARRARLAPATVTRLELGDTNRPQVDSLHAIAAVLDIPMIDVFIAVDWLRPSDLPSLSPYVRARYGELPDAAIARLQQFFDDLRLQYGTRGPEGREDEHVSPGSS
jgi:transcriptional regulator with XRE-family HTH domain